MEQPESPADTYILQQLGARIARQRLERNLTQAELAREAGLGIRTIWRIESGGSATVASLIRVLRALGLVDAINQLLPESGPSPIEELERRGKMRERASRPRGPRNPS